MSCFGKSLMCETIIFYTVNKFTLYASVKTMLLILHLLCCSIAYIYVLVSIYREIYIDSKELVLNN